MPVLDGKELRIIGFLCNWCSYGGADTAGVGRLNQPTDLRIIRVPCSGRIDPLFIAKALLNGADGVLVSGCHPRDCHYAQGNFYARRRLEVLKRFLPVIGIDDARFEYTWVSASEGQRWQQVVTSFTERIHALGPAPRLEDAEIPSSVPSINGLSPEGQHSGMLPQDPGDFIGNHKYESRLAALRESLKASLSRLDFVIGWEQGYDALHNTPLFMRTPEDVDKLVWGPLNVHNLATYLPSLRDKKVGVVVKGCDSRSIVELLQENLIERDKVMIFGMPCTGVVDLSKMSLILRDKGANIGRAEAFTASGDVLTLVANGQSFSMSMQAAAADKCLNCRYPKALIADIVIGEPLEAAAPAQLPDSQALDAAIVTAREQLAIPSDTMPGDPKAWMTFWRYHMERCIRCYACRNACPLCVCKDHCIAGSRDPQWVSQEHTVSQKLMFQIIHAIHLAGRCTECGECQRACPMGIPVLELKRHMNAIIRELFDYRAGTSPEALPPLLSFQAEETHIIERKF